MTDLIERQAAIDVLMKEWKAYKDYPYVSHVRHGLEIAIAILDNKVPSAQPEIDELQKEVDYWHETCTSYEQTIVRLMESAQPEHSTDEWCTDCKEYDQEKHCCPRWNRVIRTILQEAQLTGRWIPVTERLPYPWDERYLVSLAWGGVGVMEYKSTGFHNYGSFNPVPIESITAWMPLPEPYKEAEE